MVLLKINEPSPTTNPADTPQSPATRLSCQVDQGALAGLLRQVEPFAQHGRVIPTLACMRLEVGTGAGGQFYLEAGATDLERGIRARLPLLLGEPGVVCVSAARLRGLVERLPAGQPVTLRSQGGDAYSLRVTWGQAGKATLSGMDPQDYQELPVLPNTPPALCLPGPTLRAAAALVPFAAAKDIDRPVLRGVHLDAGMRPNSDPRWIGFQAADGFRLSLYEATIPEASADSPPDYYDVLLPATALRDARGLVPDEGALSVWFRGPQSSPTMALMAAYAGDKTAQPTAFCWSRLLEGTYPDLQRVIPGRADCAVTFQIGQLEDALDRVEVFMATKDPKVLLRRAIPGEPDGVYLTGVQLEVGNADDGPIGEVTGDVPEKWMVSRWYLRDVLNAAYAVGLGREDSLRMQVIGALAPILVTLLGRDDFTHVIMPMGGVPGTKG